MKRNTFLKIKLKTLATEAKYIRQEEIKCKKFKLNLVREQLYLHRIQVVRREARATLLAYNYLRGMRYDQCEVPKSSTPNWDRVSQMIKKYGSIHDFNHETWTSGKLLKAA